MDKYNKKYVSSFALSKRSKFVFLTLPDLFVGTERVRIIMLSLEDDVSLVMRERVTTIERFR